MNPEICFDVFDLSEVAGSNECSWCGALFFENRNAPDSFPSRQLCFICLAGGNNIPKPKFFLYFSCPNETNNCSFRSLSAAMRDHIITCEFAIVDCAFQRCRWAGVLHDLNQHLNQKHLLLPPDTFQLLRPRLMFAILYEKSLFIVKLRVNEEIARFFVIYSGLPNKYMLSVKLGLPRSFCFGKRRVVPRMHTYKGSRISFRNSLIISFNLGMLNFHLRGENIFEHVAFKMTVTDIDSEFEVPIEGKK